MSSFCPNCGLEVQTDASFCPNCGASLGQQVQEPSPSSRSSPAGGWQTHPSSADRQRSKLVSPKVVAVVIITIMAVAVVGAAASSPGGFGGGTTGNDGQPVNGPSNPFTGGQLYGAYIFDQAQADSNYTNRVVYIQDAVDAGVQTDPGTGQAYSTVDSGTVVLVWGDQAQPPQLSPGETILASCLVKGLQFSQGSPYLLLNGCVLSVSADQQ